MGDAARSDAAPVARAPAVRGPRFRLLAERGRPGAPGAAPQADPLRQPGRRPLPLLRRGDRGPGPGSRPPVRTAAGRHLPGTDPAAGRHRHARRRGDPPRPQRLRRRIRRPDRARHQVRQVQAPSAAPDRHHRPEQVPAALRRAHARPAGTRPAADRPRLPAALRTDLGDIPRPHRQCRAETALAGCRPRIHDLRHSFAVATLLGWHRSGADVQAMLPRLSAYLGHADPRHTYAYLSAAPELLALAAGRLQASQEEQTR